MEVNNSLLLYTFSKVYMFLNIERSFCTRRPDLSKIEYKNVIIKHDTQRKDDFVNCGVICIVLLEKLIYNKSIQFDNNILFLQQKRLGIYKVLFSNKD